MKKAAPIRRRFSSGLIPASLRAAKAVVAFLREKKPSILSGS